jgi:hypothetical protein
MLQEISQALKEGGRSREYNREGELAQSILYTSMELSQWNPFVLLTYANTIFKKWKTTVENVLTINTNSYTYKYLIIFIFYDEKDSHVIATYGTVCTCM